MPSARYMVLAIPAQIVVSTNNCCYNASLHDFLSSDAYHHHDYFQARVMPATLSLPVLNCLERIKVYLV